MRIAPCVLLGLTASLHAQADTANQRSDTAHLAPTVVTVLRTTLELSRAPFAVGVTHRDEIQRGKPGLALDEALAGIPGVQVDNRFNYALGERIAIRGFGARAQFGVRGVRVLLDDVPMTLADGQTSLNNVDVASVARAEVIRGPASATHGNASGGVIQLRTDRPADLSTRPLGGDLRTTVGDDGLRRYQTSIAGKAGATSYNLTGARLTFDGYREWNDARNDHASFRVARESARRELALIGNWVEYDAHNPGALARSVLDTNRRVAVPANKNTFKTGEDGRQLQIGVNWRQQMGGVVLDLSGHGLGRQVDNPIPQRIVVIDRHAGGSRLALSGASRVAGRALRLSAGTELQWQSDLRQNFVNVNGTRGADTLDQKEQVNNNAFFAQGAVDLAPRLLMMIGARYDRVRFKASDRLIAPPGNPDDSGERTMSATSPSIGLTWSATPLVDVYTNYSTSFETPTTSELANQASGAGGINQALEPQRTRSAEVGINGRVRLAGIAGSYQVSAYDARVRDALIPFEVASLPGRQYYRNAGSTKNRGIETGTSLVLRRVSLRATYTYTDARFAEYAVTTGSVTTTFDGKQVPGVAANRADATLSFQPRNLFFDFETRASSSIAVNDTNTARSPAYVVHALRAGLRDVRAGGLELTPYIGVLNLFDRKYNTSVVVNAFGGRYYEPGPPRSLYGGMSARF
jgi:iron complex outermembrane receptor protein